MADKSVTYNGSHIIQSDQPSGGYVCSEQDNARFQADLNQDGVVKAFFTNTHQPTETDDAEWKKVELNWTRSTKDKYNLLSLNASNCGGDGTTEGIGGDTGYETYIVDNTVYNTGSSSIKVTTTAQNANQGIVSYPFTPVVTGQKVSGKAVVKGSGVIYVCICELNENKQWIASKGAVYVTLSSSWQTIDATTTISPGNHACIAVCTSTAQATTFWIDQLQLNYGDPAPWVEGPYGGFNSKVSLYGIMDNGNPELIGEYNNNTIFPTSATESIVFDLAGSAGEPPLIKETGSTADGKVRLNLPMNLGNYSSIVLKHSSYNLGWAKCKIIPITGSPDYSYYSYVLGPYTVWYDSDMNTDFSDLRFAVWDGLKMADIPYYIFNYVAGTSAKVFLYIPYLLSSPNITNVYMFYGNPNATTTSASNIYLFDDFEDGHYNGGRPSPYVNYTIGTGTTSIVGSGQQISGNYSIQHHGVDNYTIGPAFWLNCDAFMVDFDFKLSVQGTGTYDPWVTLFYLQYTDANNYLRVDSYWSGTNQRVRLQKRVSGTTTTINEWSWYTHKMPVGETHHYKIIAYLPSSGTQYVSVYIDVTKIINAVNPATTLTNNCWRGFSGGAGATGIWDNIRVRPYVPHIVFDAWNEPTFGAITDDGTIVSPNSWDDTKQYLLFTLPSDYLANVPICFDVTEENSTAYETPDVVINPKEVYKLGLDHTSKYHALRVVVETDVTSADNVTWNYIKYDYSF